MRIRLSVLAVLVCLTSVCQAQAPEFPKPTKEHEWLKKFEGEWACNSKTVDAPGQPSMECKGTMTSTMLGGFWVVNRMDNDMQGMAFQGLQTIGYDTKKKKYVGTWVDSMMNHLWHYEGTVDKAGKKLSLVADGPNFIAGDGSMTKYRDSYEFKSDDLIVATSEMMGEDGEWITFMTGEVRRAPAKKKAESKE